MGIISNMLEKRSSLANPEQWLIDWFGGGAATAAGITVNEKTALENTAVLGCVKALAETVASLPLILYRRIDPDGKERAHDHPLYTILHDSPNPEMTSMSFRETLQGHLGTYGNAYAIIVWDNRGAVEALWPIRPDRIRMVKEKGRLWYMVLNEMGQEKPFSRDNIFHIPGFGYDGITGYSLISLAREAIGTAMATERYGGKFFANNATPSGILEHPTRLSEKAQENLRKAWKERHQGVDKAHEFGILEEGMKYKPMSSTQKESQFLETREFQIPEIARPWRMPPHMIQDLSDATYSNIEQETMNFVNYTCSPSLVRWEQTCWLALLKPEERKVYFIEHLVDGLLRGDTVSRYQAYQTGINNGFMCADDIRARENMNPLPDGKGKEFYMPLNMMPIGSAPLGSVSARAEHRSALRSIAGRKRIAGVYQKLFLHTADKVVKQETTLVRDALEKYRSRRDLGSFLIWLDEFYRGHAASISQDMLPVLTTYAGDVQAAIAEEVAGTAGMTSELETFIGEYADNMGNRHARSSSGQLRAVAEAETLEAVGVRLDEWDERRPTKMANRETIQAGGAVAAMALAAFGVTKLRWVAAGAETCPYCQELDGMVVGVEKTFVAKDELFEPEGADGSMQITGPKMHPPLHEGCVCMISAG